MMNLFELDAPEIQAPPEGLVYRPDFLSVREESELVEWIDAQPWNMRYARRRQFYGRSYNETTECEPIPPNLEALSVRLFEMGLILAPSHHALLNEYLPGQGIAAHVDEMPDPESQVVTISLLDTYPMEFVNIATGEKFDQWLDRRSVAVMSGPSRTEWTHEIVKRKADVIQGGGRRNRSRRISITYRTKLT